MSGAWEDELAAEGTFYFSQVGERLVSVLSCSGAASGL